ncbi:MAG TPA: ABC transporter permease subunit [Acidiferrobacteraceae bacterium]|nr:ABC transporter permease subunit [Acidiferrobacteraceae bacterium]
MTAPTPDTSKALQKALHNTRHRQLRALKDRFARWSIAAGGAGVIITIVLIFFYLMWVTLPLFQSASLHKTGQYRAPGNADAVTWHLAMEEQHEIGVRFTDHGQVVFFAADSGKIISQVDSKLPTNIDITSFAAGNPNKATVAYGLGDGRAQVVRHIYDVTYPDDHRLITPRLENPLGDAPLVVDPKKHPLVQLAIQINEDSATLVAVTDDNRLLLLGLEKSESLLGDGDWTTTRTTLQAPASPIRHIILNLDQRELYAADQKGRISFYDISDKSAPRLIQTVTAVGESVQISALQFLSGGISILAGGSDGSLGQWFPVRDAHNNYTLRAIRRFKPLIGPVTNITPEFNRKGFMAAGQRGQFNIYHSTAHSTVLSKILSEYDAHQLAIAPRANALLLENANQQIQFYLVDNEHPEISWSSLWSKVWYEGYDSPQYLWQSSSASNDYEPKFSLMPITFGTLKAAFYAMLFAIPLAILGAIYTSYFMAPRMRRLVKPSIEIMEALPTVILGFLAGLWLAPFLEKHLPGVFSLFIILPVGVLLFAYLWQRAPKLLRDCVPEGWEGALLIPIIILISWAAISISQPIEQWLFQGDIRKWLSNDLGIEFDQRNSLVVGLAMGFAVIPTIFSIAEDAIFGVPKHLTQGSLALGATPWQTLSRVVILTASPGIFSAIMIGLGRAVGETMIVLMATGNTPVMDFSIFQGMRTLSANVAVEMPEAEVASTHYRVLFLAATVLFAATFMFNTAAEIVRQRLRKKYSNL